LTGVERVEVGRIIKPHGLRGEVVVHMSSDVTDRLGAGVRVWVDGAETTVATAREHQGRPLIRFAQVSDRTAAELLRGAVVEAEPIEAVELDTYLVSELIGVPVIDGGGVLLGTVSALVDMPAIAGYDLLEVTAPDGRTWLLPAADELVEAIEDEDGLRLVAAALPEGLIDGSSAGGAAARRGEERG